MTKSDFKAFAKIIAVLNETFGNPDKSVSVVKMDFYFKALADLTIEELNDGAIRLANSKTIHTFPTPAEIREAAQGKPEDRAIYAFETLIQAIQAGGYYFGGTFQDGAIMACVNAMGGWDAVCDWMVQDREWRRKEFVKLYKAFTADGHKFEPARAIGAFEHQNALRGYTNGPTPIGNTILGLVKKPEDEDK